jgi:regulatory protein
MFSKIRNCALNYLARREHTKLELQRKLATKGFAADDIAEAINKLESQGLQSNERFVESYVAMRCKRGFGPIRITKELSERGVYQELIDQFLLEYKSSWPKLAKEAHRKKFGEKIPNELHEQAKQMRYLYQKGFDSELIRKIITSKLDID